MGEAVPGRPLPGRAGFAERLTMHERELLACEMLLRRYGFLVERIGQEATPGPWQDVACNLYDDETARQERFKPDLLASHAGAALLLKIEIKSRNPDSPNIAIEKACHDNVLAERARGIRLAYWFPGQRMAWPEELDIFRVVTDRVELAKAKTRGGAGTPYVLVRNESITTSADSFITEILWK